MKAHLSTRIRPNSEAAPWVIEEVRQLEAEVERLREIVAVNDQRLATLYDEKKQEIDRLRSLLADAANVIRCGFFDGEWATIVQTQKELLPWSAVLESRKAELVINQINGVLKGKQK